MPHIINFYEKECSGSQCAYAAIKGNNDIRFTTQTSTTSCRLDLFNNDDDTCTADADIYMDIDDCLEEDEWQFFAITVESPGTDTGTTKFYINGNMENQMTKTSGLLRMVRRHQYIGRSNDYCFYGDGDGIAQRLSAYVQSFMIWNRTLSNEEILAVYESDECLMTPTSMPSPLPTPLCDSGEFFSYDSGECEVCPAGRFNDFSSSSPRNPADQINCTACPVGHYLSDSGTDSSLHDSIHDCESCTAGTYNEKVGQTSIAACEDCYPGKISRRNASACTNCEAGSYATLAGSTACSTCPSGTMTINPDGDESGTGAYFCQGCPSGTMPDQTTESCQNW